METSGPTSGVPKAVTASSTTGSTTQWQIGQLLQATVARNDLGKVLLSIGNRQVSAETSLPLHKGQQLTLQVRNLGEQPLLRVMTNLSAPSPAADAVRMLLPKQAPLPPLLASLGQLAKAGGTTLPPSISELVRSTLKQLPDTTNASTKEGLKQALRSSGVFLENQLAHPQRTEAVNQAIHSDFKANLLRLVQVLREWPGNRQNTSRPFNPQASLYSSTAESASVAQKATQSAVTPAPAAATRSSQQPGPEQPLPSGQKLTSSTTSPQQLRRAIVNATSSSAAGAKATSSPSPTVPGGTTAAGVTTAASTPPSASPPSVATLPLPFRGTVPVPQAAAEATLDLINRLGNLRLDLLQQAEAALARIQLHQLAALPREGERGLLEWLFELPIRRGDATDLWSMRLYRDSGQQTPEHDPDQANWSVQLAFDLPGLGPVQALVQLSGETVSTRFWAEEKNTVPLFNQHLDELRRSLLDAGLKVANLECLAGSMQQGNKQPPENVISEKV